MKASLGYPNGMGFEDDTVNLRIAPSVIGPPGDAGVTWTIVNRNLHTVRNETARALSWQMTRKPNNEYREKLGRYYIRDVGNSAPWPPVKGCPGRMPVTVVYGMKIPH